MLKQEEKNLTIVSVNFLKLAVFTIASRGRLLNNKNMVYIIL